MKLREVKVVVPEKVNIDEMVKNTIKSMSCLNWKECSIFLNSLRAAYIEHCDNHLKSIQKKKDTLETERMFIETTINELR